MVKSNKALFFDRDGTIIKSNLSKDRKPLAIKELKECKIFPSAKKTLNLLKKDYLIFLITNQPDVGRGKNTKKNVDEINRFLKKKLPIKKIYTCYCEDNKCKFRKPNSGMLKNAKKKYQINLNESFVIGDRWKDIETGKNANCRTIFIDRRYNEKLKSKPNYTIKKLSEITKIIKS